MLSAGRGVVASEGDANSRQRGLLRTALGEQEDRHCAPMIHILPMPPRPRPPPPCPPCRSACSAAGLGPPSPSLDGLVLPPFSSSAPVAAAFLSLSRCTRLAGAPPPSSSSLPPSPTSMPPPPRSPPPSMPPRSQAVGPPRSPRRAVSSSPSRGSSAHSWTGPLRRETS